MLLPGHLTTIVWLTSTCLNVCEGSPAEDLQQHRYNEGKESTPYSETERRYSTSNQQHQYPQILHHRSRGHKIHAQSNNTHPYAFKLHSPKRHEVKNADGDNSYSHFTSQRSSLQAAEERADGPTKRKRGDGRKRKKKEERKVHRKLQGNSGWGSDVDDVLAALVGYSKDPSLWRFVHSVVAELDYSKQASDSSPPSASRHHYSLNRFSSWTPKEKQKPDTKEKHRKQNDTRWQHRTGGGNNDDYGGGGGDDDIDRGGGKGKGRGGVEGLREDRHPGDNGLENTGRNSTQHTQTMPKETTPQVPQFVDQDTQDLFHASLSALEQPRESPAVRSSTKINDSGIKPTHTPHFIFHKVYIDTNYDPHTGQPYHRPVLAVKAVAGEKTKVSALGKDNENDLPDSIDTLAYQLPDDTSRELPDKLEDLLASQHRDEQELTESEKQNDLDEEDEYTEEELGDYEEADDVSQNQYYRRTLTDPLYGRNKDKEFLRRDLQKDWSEDDDRAMEEAFDGQGWREVSSRRHHRRHFLHRLRQLQSFESQIKFLRRWQERLIRKRSQWSKYYPTTMT